MKIMSIKAAALYLLAFPLFAQEVSRSPFSVDRQVAETPFTITEVPGSSGNLPADVNVSGAFTDGGLIPPNIKDPRYQFVDPLTVYVRTVWPDDFRSIRQAVNYLLEPTGYRLVTSYPAPREAALLVDKPIPPIAYVHRTMPVLDALQLLVGLENYVVIDHAHRLISFQKSR